MENNRLLVPSPVSGTAFPRWTVVVLVVAAALNMALDLLGITPGIAWATLVLTACAAGGAAASWVEPAFQRRIYTQPTATRLVLVFALPPVALVGGTIASLIVGLPPALLGDQATTFLAAMTFSVWLWSAAIGTSIVAFLDVAVSRLVGSLRPRLMIAIFALMGWVGAGGLGCAWVAWKTMHQFRANAAILDLNFGAGPLSRDQVVALFATEEGQLAAIVAFALIGILPAFPAIFSAAAKLADAVLERVHPLTEGFRAITSGELDVRVAEEGPSEFIELAQNFNQMAETLALARRMERSFGQYVSEQLLDRIREQHGAAEVPTALKTATVFFADIRGFTSMSEKLEPDQVLGVLNRYFEGIVPVIDAHGGYLDKFIGDAVVVVFNGPVDQPDHAELGARCAIDLQRKVDEMNAADAFPEVGTLEVGVGMSTGPLVTGNLGSADHLEYTVIGDTVNLAARLQGEAAAGEVVVDSGAAEALPADLPTHARDPIHVKGKAAAVTPHLLWPTS